jgi:hypothetical protein
LKQKILRPFIHLGDIHPAQRNKKKFIFFVSKMGPIGFKLMNESKVLEKKIELLGPAQRPPKYG